MLVDTNVISEVRRTGGDARVTEYFVRLGDSARISAITFGELLFGIERLTDGRRKALLNHSYLSIRETFGDRVLPVSLEVGEVWGRLEARTRMMGRPVSTADGLIAATALHHDLTLMTRNTHDFEATGARLFNPWED